MMGESGSDFTEKSFLARWVRGAVLVPVAALALLSSAAGLTGNLFAQTTDIDFDTARLSRVLDALRIDDEIDVDGRLDENVWAQAPAATDFIQRIPVLGAPASERTEVRFLYDDTNLYIGVTCYQSDPDSLVINQLSEDFSFGQDDLVSVVLDTLHDQRSGFIFVANPAGAWADFQLFNDGQFDVNWDGVWTSESALIDEGWSVEMRIPFTTLRFTDSQTQVWGLNVTRGIRSRNEESVWSPVPFRFRGTRVSLAGTLRGLEGIRQGMNLNVKPFVTGGFTQSRPASDPFGVFQTDHEFDGGFDVKYSLTPSLTLDTTYRTDFAQVEADQQQVNLTRFSLFFPEKREFFLENAATFDFGPGGNLVPFFSRRIGLEAGEVIPIIGGGRVSGRVGQYDIGILAMKTEEHEGVLSNNYGVVRVKRNLLTNSWVGGIYTHRDSTLDGDTNDVYGVDAHFQFFTRLDVDAYALGSRTPGLYGDDVARRIQTGWTDDEFSVSAQYNEFPVNFKPEVGYIRRRDVAQYQGDVAWNPLFEGSSTVRNLIFDASAEYFEGSSSREIETRTQDFTTGIQFESGASIRLTVAENFERLTEDFGIRDDVVIPAGDHKYRDYTLNLQTNSSERLSGQFTYTWGDFWDGTRRFYSTRALWRPSFRSSIDLSYARNDVELAGGMFSTDLIGARFLHAFTARVSLNAFFQYNADTNRLSSNIRFRLIHSPLSDLFIVYNDVRDTDIGQTRERALIVKLTKLFSF